MSFEIPLVKLMKFLCLLSIFFPISTLGAEKKLESPIADFCAERRSQAKIGITGYYFSWLEQETVNLHLNWLDARNWCRLRCMDLISLETPNQINLLKSFIERGNVQSAWTSGRLCDFGNECNRPEFHPQNENGWFWSGTGKKMPPTSENCDRNDWSKSGGLGIRQPDSRHRKFKESCLAYHNNVYEDGIQWHDEPCQHLMAFACEDNEDLLQFARTHSNRILTNNLPPV